jgi:uncharacterized protein (DUF427 family)
MESNSGPGYRQHPEHHVDLDHVKERVRVTFAGEPIAESGDVIAVRETGYDPVYYFSRDSVRMSCLARTDHHTKCPFKGEASYFSLNVAGHEVENGAWSYEHPYDEVIDIKGRVAFYPDKVDAITVV